MMEEMRVEANEDGEKENEEEGKWREFYTSSTLHGFRYLFEETGYKRILWIIIFCAAIVGSCYLFFGVIEDFSKLKTITMTKELFTEKPVEFPTLTFCSFNPETKAKIASHQNSDDIWSTYEQILSSANHEKFSKHQKHPKNNFTEKLEKILRILNVTTLGELSEKLQINFNDMLHDTTAKKIFEASSSCYFEGEPCNSTSFRKVLTEHFGLCYEFNYFVPGKPPKTTSKVGYGLKLFANIHADRVAWDRHLFNGIAVLIHPYGTPATSHYSIKAMLPVGTSNSIGLSTSHLTLLPPPYESRCGSKNYTFIKNTYPYSKAMCELDCTAKKINDSVGCLSYSFEALVDKKHFCKPDQYLNISKEIYYFAEYQERCRQDCPYECSFTRYEMTSSESIQLGTKAFFSKVARKTNKSLSEAEEYVRSNIIRLGIKFSKTSTTEQSVVPTVTSVTMLGSIGGNFGLCLGFSFLTFFEFLFYFLDVCIKRKWYRKKCRKSNGDEEKS